MTRRRRTEIVAKAGPEFAAALAGAVKAAREARIIQEPRRAMVMVKYRESARGGLFYLGEVLVTEAKVSVDGRLGLGIAQHDDEIVAADLALNAAIIDAAYEADAPECAAWEALMADAERRIAAEAAAERRRTERSKVSFDTMDAPNDD